MRGTKQSPPDEGALIEEDAPTRDAGPPASFLSGTVWVPGNGPGQVPEKQEIPVAGALVQLTTKRPKALQDGVFCESCAEPAGVYTVSDHRGAFRLGPFAQGKYWLSLRKGQFRLEREVFIEQDGEVELSSQLTILPSIHDPERGQILPKMALAVGHHDSIENVLGKMGIGGVTRRGAWRADGPGAERIDLYDNGVEEYEGKPYVGTLADLVRNYDRMSQYHVIFIPCSNFEPHGEVITEPEVLRNIRRYVSSGGKLYVTDWSSHWHDNVFPAHVEFASQEDTPAEAYSFEEDVWNPTLFSSANGQEPYDSTAAAVVDQSLHEWLDGQWGPIVERPVAMAPEDFGLFSADSFTAYHSWSRIENVFEVRVGVDRLKNEVVDVPQVFVDGDRSVDAGVGRFPLTVSYRPAGCGRVLYSTYHTTDGDHPGLLAQERILLYLIMEMTVCRPGLPPEVR